MLAPVVWRRLPVWPVQAPNYPPMPADNNERLRPFFTPKALAACLSISERTVRQMLADGKIASYKIGGQRRIAAEDVDAYLAKHRKEAVWPQART